MRRPARSGPLEDARIVTKAVVMLGKWNGWPPTHRELCEYLVCSHEELRKAKFRAVEMGWLVSKPRSPRAVKVTKNGRRALVGRFISAWLGVLAVLMVAGCKVECRRAETAQDFWGYAYQRCMVGQPWEACVERVEAGK